ncbi:hypothetical protein KSX_35220 [Ktedonospora formicarum]|uniref:Uncharacterized protein n=1 Tax=Ktedonospora formicarum TaxID=2778364 RepID=A0A8J3HX31_9CHLR|nr:hypothetical protein KSX_35220 [Ktedonospora formicarum]
MELLTVLGRSDGWQEGSVYWRDAWQMLLLQPTWLSCATLPSKPLKDQVMYVTLEHILFTISN